MTILMTGGDLPSARQVCKCGTLLEWRDCWNCDEDGFTDHDCGEDCCCCADPEPNVECDICDGDSGWMACPICTPEES